MESQIIKCRDWEDFEAQLADMVKARTEEKARSPDRDFSGFLFRGQRDSSWGLNTTLERSGLENMSFESYYQSLWRIQPSLQTLMANHFENLGRIQYDKWMERNETLIHSVEPYGYTFMAFLRHHSFPSPLLDWSTSPYVAAFFAFSEAELHTNSVALYVYQDRAGAGKFGASNQPYIQSLGPYAVVHRRHVMQQSQYTICMQNNQQKWHYVSHEGAFNRPLQEQQDLLWKFTIPTTEKNKVLSRLDEHNLNAYSLFASDEALVKTLAFRELLSRHW